MNINLLFRTILHLKPRQIFYQVKNRIVRIKYIHKVAPSHTIPVLSAEPIPRFPSLYGDEFTFLNRTHHFTDWNYVDEGTLFTYNLNYFDYINSTNIDSKEASKWIDRFIDDIPSITLGMDPYPIALRSINWMKYFCKHPDCVTKVREDSLWSQLCLLGKKLEYHLLGNHLLEDLYALYIGGCYFNNEIIKTKVYKLLINQLNEQTLTDGAHYEQSPMYHCILLDRLLDCINFGQTSELIEIAQRQLGWLSAMCYKDGNLPLFNDSAFGIAPTPNLIFDYARRLGITWKIQTLGESGYRRLTDDKTEIFIDCGQITATYQPGHTHADAFTYEMRVDGIPIVVDTGISTYEKTVRRQYERSTIAHNCVCVGNNNSDEVWGGFRVGRRCNVRLIHDGDNIVEAYHDGFRKNCFRKIELCEGELRVEDRIKGDAVSYVHLAAGISPDRVHIEGATSVKILNTKYSVEYNRFIDNITVAIYFTDTVRYRVY